MNYSDLIAALAAKENLTSKQATEIIKVIFDGFKGAPKQEKISGPRDWTTWKCGTG